MKNLLFAVTLLALAFHGCVTEWRLQKLEDQGKDLNKSQDMIVQVMAGQGELNKTQTQSITALRILTHRHGIRLAATEGLAEAADTAQVCTACRGRGYTQANPVISKDEPDAVLSGVVWCGNCSGLGWTPSSH